MKGLVQIKFFLVVVICAFASTCLSFAQSVGSSNELLDQVFGPAKNNDLIMDLGNTKQAVGSEVFKQSVKVSATFQNSCIDMAGTKLMVQTEQECVLQGGTWSEKGLDADKEPSLLVRITMFILRITIVLAITMTLYNAIYIVIESLSEGKITKSKDNLLYIVGGLLLSLMSLGIINLVSSVGMRSLQPKEGCMVNGQFFEKGDQLKEYICLHAGFGHTNEVLLIDKTYQGRQWDPNHGGVFSSKHCLIAGEWKKILVSEEKSKCTELGGSYGSF